MPTDKRDLFERPDIMNLPPQERAKHLAQVLYGRMASDGIPQSVDEARSRIQQEIDEAGWGGEGGVTVEDVYGEVDNISDYMGDLGPEAYLGAVRLGLRTDFGVVLSEDEHVPTEVILNDPRN